MKLEAQRIAIATACGFTFRDESKRYPDEPDWQKYKAVYRGDGFIGLAKPDWIPVPEYLKDLHAMHEAVKVLNKDEQREFAEWLADSRPIDGIGIWDYSDAFIFVTATAEEWAEAFLRAKHLWIDES